MNYTDRSEGLPPPSRCVGLGDCKISSKKLVKIARSNKLNGKKYNLLDRNCQLWCQEFCSEIPGLDGNTNIMRDVKTVLDQLDDYFKFPFFPMILVPICLAFHQADYDSKISADMHQQQVFDTIENSLSVFCAVGYLGSLAVYLAGSVDAKTNNNMLIRFHDFAATLENLYFDEW